MPSIDIIDPIPADLCDRFAQCFAPGVIEVDGKANSRNRTARVANPRLDTVSREVLRHDEFKDRVALGRIRDHFIFSVESAGQYPPEELVRSLRLDCADACSSSRPARCCSGRST